MKRIAGIVLCFLLAGFTQSTLFAASQVQTSAKAASFEINAGLNDAWVSADAPFQGFFFTVFPDLELFFLS